MRNILGIALAVLQGVALAVATVAVIVMSRDLYINWGYKQPVMPIDLVELTPGSHRTDNFMVLSQTIPARMQDGGGCCYPDYCECETLWRRK